MNEESGAKPVETTVPPDSAEDELDILCGSYARQAQMDQNKDEVTRYLEEGK